MSLLRGLLLTVVLAAIAAALGVWVGSQYGLARTRPPSSLDELLHEKLHLTAQQQARIAGLERDHAAKSAALEGEMRAANRELAQAYEERPAYTAKVQAAIDRLHRAMDALQKETMLHVIAMRQVLSPAQAAQFDETVVKSLTDQRR